ncbi:MAG: hypothetical protein ACK4N5_21320, partial [Myxococcales bacterium]
EECNLERDRTASGVCTPGGKNTAGVVAERCLTSEDCAEGFECEDSQFEQFPLTVSGRELPFPVRKVRACVKNNARCRPCTSDTDCIGSNAPKCLNMAPTGKPEQKFCTNECQRNATPVGFVSGCELSACTAAADARGMCRPVGFCGVPQQ